jgi:hypothetical protein
MNRKSFTFNLKTRDSVALDTDLWIQISGFRGFENVDYNILGY